MARARVYPPKPAGGNFVTEFSTDQLGALGVNAVSGVALAEDKSHGLYRWGTLHPLVSAFSRRNWLYVPDVPGPEGLAIVSMIPDEVTVWKIALTKI